MRRKSVAEKKLLGTYRDDRDNRKRVQFATANGLPIRIPAYVRANKLALAEWKAVTPHLIAEGILKPTDVSILGSYCLLFARWRAAALDVETNGQTIMVTSSTRTGSCTKPVSNPSVRHEVLYQAAMMKAAVKLGLNPLDRPRIEVTEDADDDSRDPFEKFLDNDDDDPELAYLELPKR
jgi:P27 family predicted phage terminase small subunit